MFAVTKGNQPFDIVRVAVEAAHLLTAFDVPDAYSVILRAGEKGLSIVGERQTPHRHKRNACLMPHERSLQLARGGI